MNALRPLHNRCQRRTDHALAAKSLLTPFGGLSAGMRRIMVLLYPARLRWPGCALPPSTGLGRIGIRPEPAAVQRECSSAWR